MRRRFPWSVWRTRRALGRLLAEHKIDLFVCHGAWLYALLARAAPRQAVLWLHGTFRPQEWADRTAASLNPALTIAVSHDVRRSALPYFSNQRIEVLHAPFEPPIAAMQRESARAKFQLDARTVLITQVSRIESGKGHEVLLRALRELREVADWKCWIVGGPQRANEQVLYDSMQMQAASFGIADRVVFLGERNDVPVILKASDIYCLPNTSPEGFSVAILEAMSASLAVVSSDIGGTVEQVNDSCGILVEPGNVTALAAALRKLIVSKDARTQIGAGGPARVAELCSPQRQMHRFVDLLASIR